MFFKELALRLMKLLNAFLMTMPFAIAWFAYYAERIAEPFYNMGNWLLIALFFLLYIAFGRVYGAFWISLNRISESVYSQALAACMVNGIMYIITCLLMRHLPDIWPVLGVFAAQIVISAIWSFLAHIAFYILFPATKTIIVYDERQGMEKLIHEYGFEKKFTVIKTLTVDNCINNLDLLKNAQTVFVSGVHSHERNIILKYCVANNIMMYLIPRIGGSMSVVGPRPERPEIASQYEEQIPEFKLRLQAKAGLTGYAQVYGKYNTTPYDKLQMDLLYIAHPSFWEDLRIIFATIKILFVPESTEGVAEGQQTAMGK